MGRVSWHDVGRLLAPARRNSGRIDGRRDEYRRGIDGAQRLRSGYNVTLVVDAMTDRDADAHRHSVEKIFSRLGETAKTDELLELLSEAPVR
jgi:hypothetical protein